MRAVVYPPELEAHWLAVAGEETKSLSDRDTLRRMLPDIQRLADRFTLDRPGDSEATALYLRDTRDCAAYSLYFAPQTYARLTHILAELPPFPVPGAAPLRILDLGCGTGAASWAMLDYLGPRPVVLDARDHSRAALRTMHDLFTAQKSARWPQAQLRTRCAPLEDYLPEPASADVILIHYVLNELPPASRRELLSRAARALAPGGRMIIAEPLLRAAGDYLRDLRAFALAELKLHILAPCPHELACPLAEPCHDVRTWVLPRSLQIVNATLRRDLRYLAFAPLVLSHEPVEKSDTLRVRVVGSPTHAKGQTLCPACCPDGQMRRLQLLHRDFDAAGRKELRRLERGQVLQLAGYRPLGDPSLYRATPGHAQNLKD